MSFKDLLPITYQKEDLYICFLFFKMFLSIFLAPLWHLTLFLYLILQYSYILKQ
jgi:hypothetical protein